MGTKNTIEFINSIFEEFNIQLRDEWNDFKYLLDAYEYQLKDFLESPESLDEPLLTPEDLGRFDRENLEDYNNIIEDIIKKLACYDSNYATQHAINKLRDDLHDIVSNAQDEDLVDKIYDDYLHFISEVLAGRRIVRNFITCLGLDI